MAVGTENGGNEGIVRKDQGERELKVLWIRWKDVKSGISRIFWGWSRSLPLKIRLNILY